MGKTKNKNSGYILILTTIFSYIIVRIVYKLTGFYYSFDEGIFNIKLLIDLSIWLAVFIPIHFLVKRLFHKTRA